VNIHKLTKTAHEQQKQHRNRLPDHGGLYGIRISPYLRDFAPGKEEWVNSYSVGKHFESRLAHVHGNLFAFLNILIGYLLLHFNSKLGNTKTISWLALTGLLMPIGIPAEIYFGAPPVFVLIGAIAMTTSVLWLGISFLKMKTSIV
jgi:hypothetical protein